MSLSMGKFCCFRIRGEEVWLQRTMGRTKRKFDRRGVGSRMGELYDLHDAGNTSRSREGLHEHARRRGNKLK